jgi:hypothetical protein
MTINLYPCYDESFQQIVQGGKQVYYVRVNKKGTTILGTEKMVKQIAQSFPEQKVNKLDTPFVVSVIGSEQYAGCSHHWLIKRSNGVCRLCGEKQKFVSQHRYSRTVFLSLFPCFDQYGHKVLRKGKQVYKLTVYYGNSDIVDNNEFVTSDMIDGYVRHYLMQDEGYRYYAVNIRNTPFVISSVQRKWKLSEDITPLKFLTFFKPYLLHDYEQRNFRDQIAIAQVCKQIVKSHIQQYGPYELIYFNPGVHLQIVRYYQGRYAGHIPEDCICIIRDKSKAIRKVRRS